MHVRKIHPQVFLARSAANKKKIEPWLFVRGWTVYLRGIHRQPETSQTRSNGTKVAETKEKKGELEESTTRMRSTRKRDRDKIERKINRDRLTLDEVNLSNRYHWWCTHDFFMHVFWLNFKYKYRNWYPIEANYLSITCCTIKWFKRELNDFEEYIIWDNSFLNGCMKDHRAFLHDLNELI